MGLLISTAMTAVALLLSGAPDAAQAQTDMHVASRDPNVRFLCTYGQFLVSAFSNENSGNFNSSWTHVAVPITGHGQTVRRIKVIEAEKYTSTSAFTVGIYSNTPSGIPGKLIAGGTGRYPNTLCGPAKISIAPTKLKRNTTYWIEETVKGRFGSASVSFYWIADPNTKRKAYVQHHRYHVSSSGHSSYTSPWTKQTIGPYLKLR